MKYEECEQCGGSKAAYNSEKEEWVCNNRSCPKSPMNKQLRFI